MPTPVEHKTVKARILAYAQESGWRSVPQAVAERRWRNDSATIAWEIIIHKTKRQTLQDLFRTLLHELMTGKERVNIPTIQ